mmetsp:Transcript_16514/g.30688  ORF Transcript_16514/g.30688 Transcript_16514/m.30688 type:complete len:443 (+) Transcript_16514:275-1603(+)
MESLPNNDEELRKLLTPKPTAKEVVAAIRQSFMANADADIQVVKELESYDDKNLWISIAGNHYLAKVHNGVESRDLIQYISMSSGKDDVSFRKSAIHLQNAIMMHLNQHGITTNQPQEPVASKLPTPVAIHSLPVVSKEHSPCQLVVRLLKWVPGRPMSSFSMLPIEALADAGRFLGKLSVCLSSLPSDELEAAKRYHQWDGKNTLDLKDFIKYIKDDRKRSMVNSVLDAFKKDLIDTNIAESSFSKGMIHGDFNDANFVLDEDFCVTGVIDFGDSVESWRILDLSIAMAYAMLTPYGKQGRSLSAAAALLRGYNSVCSVTVEERHHLILLIACRLSCSVTLGAYSYQQNPGNEYLLLHAAPAWNALDLIWGTDPDRRADMKEAINRLFDCACSKTGFEDNKDEVSSTNPVIDCSDLTFPDPSLDDPLESVRLKQNKRAKQK